MKFYYRYIREVVPAVEMDVLRIGTNWHALMEIIGTPVGVHCPACLEDQVCSTENKDKWCCVCGGERELPEDKTAAIIRYMDHMYSQVPSTKTETEWAIEKNRLFNAAMAYILLRPAHDFPVLDNEVRFTFPLRNHAGRKIRGFELGGEIDKLLHDAEGKRVIILDHKSTSTDINSDLFWSRFNMDIQTKLYPMALYEMQNQGLFDLAGHSVSVMIEAFYKPQTTPSKLTQAETKEFVKTGLHCGKVFEIDDSGHQFLVNGCPAELFPGAKEGTLAIRETPEMYGARVFADIMAEPTKYFGRREIARTTKELEDFRSELIGMAAAIRAFEKHNLWYTNEDQCEARYKCDYIPICYNGINIDEVEEIPGFTMPKKG
jgi:hypothetical protein